MHCRWSWVGLLHPSPPPAYLPLSLPYPLPSLSNLLHTLPPPAPPPPSRPRLALGKASPGRLAPPLSASPALAVRDKEAPPRAGHALPVKAQPPAPHPQPSEGPPTKPPHKLRTAAPTREGESDRHGGGQAREPLLGGARTRRLALGKTGSGVGRLACSCPTRLQAHPRSPLANSSAVRAPHCASWPGDRAGYHVGGRGTVGRSL